ncbi:hypothetical protein GCM10009815_25790 [Nocardioides marmoribigeumensis]
MQYGQAHPVTVLTIHGFPHFESQLRHNVAAGYVRSRALRTVFRAGVQSASRVIAISDEAAAAATREGVTVVRIPNPIANEFFSVERRPGNDFISVGNLIPRKNQLTLIRAFARYVQNGGDGDLLLVGGEVDGEYGVQCRREASQCAERVHFLGALARREVAQLLGSARVSVSASRRETSSIALSESFAANCPVVCLDAGTARQQVLTDKFGIVLPLHSGVDDLAAALASCPASPTLAGSELRESVQDRRPRAVALQTVQVYERAVASCT